MTKLWGGRFSKKTNKLVEEFTRSIHYDHKLAEYDGAGSLIHINVLKSAGLLTNQEHAKLKKGLWKILKSIEDGKFKPDRKFEDIHSQIQHMLEQDRTVGKVALKLHTCRSRNDQVVFDTKYYCLDKTSNVLGAARSLMKTLEAVANKNKRIFIPGYTHLQHAIPVPLANYFLAHSQMLLRDLARFSNAAKNINLTQGAGALAGTAIQAAKYNQAAPRILNGRVKPCRNSIDAVSDRDFVIEILSALAILQTHLSRLAEDMILWASQEFGFITIDDAFCTGSSLMPQKKNPDVLELVRGYAGRLTGNLVNVLVMMKGLPLAYNRDMQLDKEPLFDSFEIVEKELKVLNKLFKNVTFNKENIANQLNDESLYATDLVDYLVRKNVPFKEAHAIIGQLIQAKYKDGRNVSLKDLSDKRLKKFHPALSKAVLKKIMNPETSIRSKKSVSNPKAK